MYCRQGFADQKVESNAGSLLECNLTPDFLVGRRSYLLGDRGMDIRVSSSEFLPAELITRNAVYACIVTSVTIGESTSVTSDYADLTGFGDFSPETTAGKVFFIPFVLLAVPIVTSFAVQTITGLVSIDCDKRTGADGQLSTFSNRGHVTDAIRHAAATGADWCRSHSELVEKHRGAYDRLATTYSEPVAIDTINDEETEERKPVEMPSDVDKQQILVRQLLDRVVKLEMQARRLLLENLDHGVARTLLVADRNGTRPVPWSQSLTSSPSTQYR